MVPLKRTAHPEDLDERTKHELVSRFLATGQPVWKRTSIVKALTNLSSNKCAYCEMLLGEESKYLEVEHFYCKSAHPERVVDWDNLLPVCRRCNGAKLDHDVAVEAIIDPTQNIPKQHLKLVACRLRARSSMGASTIDVVNLNDFDRVVKKRFEVEQSILDQVELVLSLMENYKTDTSARCRNKLNNATRALLMECQPEAAYAATAASALMASDFASAIPSLSKLPSWANELEKMYAKASEIALI